MLALAGVALSRPELIAGGALWTAHVGGDQALVYGLKLPGGFRDTHLRRIGRG